MAVKENISEETREGEEGENKYSASARQNDLYIVECKLRALSELVFRDEAEDMCFTDDGSTYGFSQILFDLAKDIEGANGR